MAFDDKIMLLQQGYTGEPLIYDNPLVYNSTNLGFDTRGRLRAPTIRWSSHTEQTMSTCGSVHTASYQRETTRRPSR